MNYGWRFVTLYRRQGLRTSPWKKNANRQWSSEEALPIAKKRREVKGKGERDKYTHLNAEFQRIPRRDKKAFFSDQCKEIKENKRMGKTVDLFKKRQRNQRSNCQHLLDHGKGKRVPEKHLFLLC